MISTTLTAPAQRIYTTAWDVTHDSVRPARVRALRHEAEQQRLVTLAVVRALHPLCVSGGEGVSLSPELGRADEQARPLGTTGVVHRRPPVPRSAPDGWARQVHPEAGGRTWRQSDSASASQSVRQPAGQYRSPPDAW